MSYCSTCLKRVQTTNDDGLICCSNCGKVLHQDFYSIEPTFVKDAAGQSHLAGNFVRTVQSDYSASRDRILQDARYDIENMQIALKMNEAADDSLTMPAMAFFTIAVERNFTKGRRKEHVLASCLYISCRELKKPFLLIDFSEYLRVNVYVLGAVFLQLCKLLRLEEHPIVQKPVDPSLFIHRFTDRLLGENNSHVRKAAVRIIASMKRDWMQTGRKPSGLCGAAIYIAALAHGYKFSKSDVVRVVHICEATLTKRLIEFEQTDSGGLTIEELNAKAELEKDESTTSKFGMTACGTNDLLCEHKGSGVPSVAHGLCTQCYMEFINISGGLDGGCEPPAFQCAERKRMIAIESSKKNFEKKATAGKASGYDTSPVIEPELTETTSLDTSSHDFVFDKLHGSDDASPEGCDEAENFSDIDDVEVDGYLHNEEEKHFKKIIWEEMNKEYLEEQAAKEAAAEATSRAFEANFQGDPKDFEAAKKLAMAAQAAVAKSRKERQQKRAAEAKNSFPAQTAAEATRQMLTRKRLSSKINYDVLDKLFDESDDMGSSKKRTKSDSYGDNKSVLEDGKDDESLQHGPGLDSGVDRGEDFDFLSGENVREEYNYGEDSNYDNGYNEDNNYDNDYNEDNNYDYDYDGL